MRNSSVSMTVLDESVLDDIADALGYEKLNTDSSNPAAPQDISVGVNPAEANADSKLPTLLIGQMSRFTIVMSGAIKQYVGYAAGLNAETTACPPPGL